MHVISCALTHTHFLSLHLPLSFSLALPRLLSLSFPLSHSPSLSLFLSFFLSLSFLSPECKQRARARAPQQRGAQRARCAQQPGASRITWLPPATTLFSWCATLSCTVLQCVAVCCSVAFIGLFCKRSDHNARTKDVYSQRCRMPQLTCSDDESIVFACYLFGRTNWQRLRFFALSLPLRVCSAERCCCAPLCASGSGAVRQQRGASACDPRHDMCRHTPGAQRD